MIGTNHSKALCSVLGLLAVALAATLPLLASAQEGAPRTLLNVHTGTALMDNGPSSQALLITKIWAFGDSQKWQSFSALGNLQGPYRMNSLRTPTLVMDILGHLAYVESFPVILASRLLVDNTTQWRFQAWHENAVLYGGRWYRQFKNAGSGKCLSDSGQIGVGGGVVQVSCSSADRRQLWSIYNHMTGKWETALP